MTLAVLVLAAGGSRRLGRPKQLVRLAGRTLLARAIDRAERLQPLWIGVVVGAGAGRLVPELTNRPVEVVRARGWRAGLSASLKAGIARVPRGASHVLVTAVDQWAISASDLRQLVRYCSRSPVAAAYEGIVGIPAIFPRRALQALAALEGDRGARRLLESPHTGRLALASAAIDLDTPTDLTRLRSVVNRKRYLM